MAQLRLVYFLGHVTRSGGRDEEFHDIKRPHGTLEQPTQRY